MASVEGVKWWRQIRTLSGEGSGALGRGGVDPRVGTEPGRALAPAARGECRSLTCDRLADPDSLAAQHSVEL